MRIKQFKRFPEICYLFKLKKGFFCNNKEYSVLAGICIKSKTFRSFNFFWIHNLEKFYFHNLVENLMKLFVFNQFYLIDFLMYKSFKNTGEIIVYSN